MTATLITAESLLSMPEDGVDRWLHAGQLRERPYSYNDRLHAQAMTQVAIHLSKWLDHQPRPHGEVLCGEAGIILGRSPDTLIGADVAFISAEVIAAQEENAEIIEGVPTLAVEILSPRDTIGWTNDKIDAYLDAGVPLIWLLDPRWRTVTIFHRGAAPKMVTDGETLIAESELAGFRVPVGELFE